MDDFLSDADFEARYGGGGIAAPPAEPDFLSDADFEAKYSSPPAPPALAPPAPSPLASLRPPAPVGAGPGGSFFDGMKPQGLSVPMAAPESAPPLAMNPRSTNPLPDVGVGGVLADQTYAAVSNLGKGLAGIIPAGLRTIENLRPMMRPEYTRNLRTGEVETRDSFPKPLTELAGKFDAAVESAIPVNPNVEQTILNADAPRAFGQMGTMLPFGPAGAAVIGGIMGFDEGYRDASQFTEDESKRQQSALLNVLPGLTESILPQGGGATKLLKSIAKEGLQEGAQTLASNVIAKDVVGYDPKRDRSQNVGKSALVGGLVGGGVSGVSSLANRGPMAEELQGQPIAQPAPPRDVPANVYAGAYADVTPAPDVRTVVPQKFEPKPNQEPTTLPAEAPTESFSGNFPAETTPKAPPIEEPGKFLPGIFREEQKLSGEPPQPAPQTSAGEPLPAPAPVPPPAARASDVGAPAGDVSVIDAERPAQQNSEMQKKAGREPWERPAANHWDEAFPSASKTVDGLLVRDKIPNQDSISGYFDDYDTMKGIREVPLTDLEPEYHRPEVARQLAGEISRSGELNPIIVGVDPRSGKLAVIEGQHRVAALQQMGKKTVPAKVVVGYSSEGGDAHYYAVQRALEEGRPVPPEVLADYPDLAARAKPAPPTVKQSLTVPPTPEESPAVPPAPNPSESPKSSPPPAKPPAIERAAGEESPGSYASLRKVDINRDRVRRGDAELTSPQRKSWSEVEDRAIKKGYHEDAVDIARRVTQEGGTLSDEEAAGVLLQRNALDRSIEAKSKEIADASRTDDERMDAAATRSRLEDERLVLEDAAISSGTETARALAIRRLTRDRADDSIASVVSRARMAKGKDANGKWQDLTPKERTQLESEVTALSKANAELQAKSEELSKFKAERLLREGAAQKRSKAKVVDLETEYSDLRGKLLEARRRGCAV